MATLIKENLQRIQSQISAASSARPGRIRLVAVSKTKPPELIEAAYALGQRHFGENYIQELCEKASKLPEDIQWHFIGQLQTNKAKLLVSIPNLFVVESVDSLKKAMALNKACQGRQSTLNIMLQVNTSGELSKGGIEPHDCVQVARQVINDCRALALIGLMTIGSPEHSAMSPNPDFDVLVECRREIQDALSLSDLELSMGMSDDFETAIMQGSTNVRVGSGIFGARQYPKAPSA